jgi:hypothetical protein
MVGISEKCQKDSTFDFLIEVPFDDVLIRIFSYP